MIGFPRDGRGGVSVGHEALQVAVVFLKQLTPSREMCHICLPLNSGSKRVWSTESWQFKKVASCPPQLVGTAGIHSEKHHNCRYYVSLDAL
jgi:hypothetical protein